MPLDLTPATMPYYTIDENTPQGTIFPKYTYRALITQTSTNAPTATILSNNIGTIVWSYLTTGQYQGTLANSFPLTKTACLTQTKDNNGTTLLFRTADNTIALQSSVGGAYLDAILNNTYIQIDIYN